MGRLTSDGSCREHATRQGRAEQGDRSGDGGASRGIGAPLGAHAHRRDGGTRRPPRPTTRSTGAVLYTGVLRGDPNLSG